MILLLSILVLLDWLAFSVIAKIYRCKNKHGHKFMIKKIDGKIELMIDRISWKAFIIAGLILAGLLGYAIYDKI